jgi:hypothetical protein
LHVGLDPPLGEDRDGGGAQVIGDQDLGHA